jgi:exodeoxyribonuclease V alpha subunit
MGDVQQLTPIGNCQVFADILNSDVVPTVKLTKPHRQALRSGIIPTSINVAKQEQIFNTSFEGNEILGELKDMEIDIYKNKADMSEDVISHFQTELAKINDIMEVQIVVPMKLKGCLSCYNLNTQIQMLYNPIIEDSYIDIPLTKIKDTTNPDYKGYKIHVGDKVINTKNNYKCINNEGKITPVFNGNIGTITNIENKCCTVNFIGIGEITLNKAETSSLELGYAISIHKSQGSGFHSAIVAIDGSSYVLNNSELLYTGLTRAKKYCVLIGKNSAIHSAISRKEVNKKQTFLKELLQQN